MGEASEEYAQQYAKPAPYVETPERRVERAPDRWDVEANSHLLGLVLRKLKQGRSINERETRILVAWKNTWAEDMRAEDTGKGVPVERQREVWREVMQAAADEIRALA